MPGYDPQKNRARHRPTDDDPAPVEALLGPVAGEPVAPAAAEPVSPAVATPPTITKRVAEPPVAEKPAAEKPKPVETPKSAAEAELAPAPKITAAPAAPTARPSEPSPAPAGRSRIVPLAVVGALVALLVFVLLRRRRRS